MTASEVKAAFIRMSPQRQMQVLSRLALELTLQARCVYPGQVGEQVAVKKLPALNELQHTVTGQLAHLAAGDERRYADDVFVAILFEKAGRWENGLAEAFERSLR